MISVSDIEKLAELARIELTSAEKEQFGKEIDSILGYVAQIQKATGSAVENTEERVGAVHNIMRPDEVRNTPGSNTKDILAEAPHTEGDYITVQKIIAQ